MSFLTAARAVFGPRLTVRSIPSAVSAFHSSPSPLSLKESDTNRDENLAEVYDAEKNTQLKNSEKGKGHWKQSLASNSEASVKADREELSDDAKDPKTMQERTKNLPNEDASPDRS